jgi:potassium channel subfamily K
MACNASEETVLSGVVEPTPQESKTNALKRRIYGCFKGAPLAVSVPAEAKGSSPTPLFGSISVKLHPNIKQVGMFVGIYISVVSMCFYILRKQFRGSSTNKLVDSVYYCISTLTTVGYGDLAPHTTLTKLLSSIFAFAGMGLVGLVLNKTGDYFLEKQETMFLKAMHMHKKLGPDEFEKEFDTITSKDRRLALTNFLKLIITISGLVVFGLLHLAVVDEFDFIDAIYWISVTITTLGYEDESFKHTKGRIFAVFWILSSTVSLAQCFLQVIELKFQCRQRAFVKRFLAQRMTNLDLEAAGPGDDGVVE